MHYVGWSVLIVAAGLLGCTLSGVGAVEEVPLDWRNILSGTRIPDQGYCDQPYIVRTADGNWLCTLTTGSGHEGQGGQHVVASISSDRGRTWGPLVDIEPATGPEASWVIPLVTPGGRVYVFYDYNGERIDTMPGQDKKIRADMLGWYCYRYSDDHGRTWSTTRYRLPMRVTACDRGNDWQGKVQIFWGIDKPKADNGIVRFGFTKLGRYMLDQGEGWLFSSDNILTETDPEKIRWRLLPDGDHGIRLPVFGSVQEEHNHVPLGAGRLYMVYRTTTGYPCHTYSEDGGQTWLPPRHMTYTPDGPRIKTPRACPKLWRCANGKFLFWFHNHSGRDFKSRNPAWISGGILVDGRLHWSQPEVLLYDAEKDTRMSYPDLVEEDGRYWITETQKTVARIHEIPAAFLERLWSQHTNHTVSARGVMLSDAGDIPGPEGRRVPLAELPDLSGGGGFSLDLWLRLPDAATGRMLLDSRDDSGRGLLVRTGREGCVELTLCDGRQKAVWASDAGRLTAGTVHHVVFTIDGGPRLITVVVDGRLCDGGEQRQYGWGRFAATMQSTHAGGTMQVAPAVSHLRLYDRPLTTSEAVGNYRAGAPE